MCSGTRTKSAARESITFDDVEVTRTSQDGRVEKVRWDELERIEVVTTDQGPFADDVFWLLVGDVGGCVAPSEALGTTALVDHLFGLPGFDFGHAIEAMTCATNARFLVWQRSSSANSA